MHKDADPKYFAGIYIVCGYTDLRYGIDSLAAIIEQKYHMSLFVPNTLLLFKRVESGHFSWPRSSDELRTMDARQFDWLMKGFSIDPVIQDVNPDRSA